MKSTPRGGEFDASVWISPSGAISFGCFHSHCAGKDWKTFYRPWLEAQAEQNGFKGRLKFGEASETKSHEQTRCRSISLCAGGTRPIRAP